MKCGILLLTLQCVHATIVDKPKISGSLPAIDTQFPYHAAIKHRPDKRFLCSGSIIGKEWVLTIATCVDIIHARHIMVIVGSVHNLDNYGYGYGVDRIAVHPRFEPLVDGMHDIALIKIDGFFNYGTHVSSIGVSSKIQLPLNLHLWFTGWGATEVGKPTSDVLRYIMLNSTISSACHKPNFIYESLVQCALSTNKNGPCTGDEGGPLVWGGEQVGIAALTGWSCQGSEYTMFTKIGSYRTWIKEVSGI